MAGIKWKTKMSQPKVVAVWMATILLITAGVSITATAAGTDLILEKNGGTDSNTKVYLGVSKETAADVSFEVPLYYTMAVTPADPSDENGNRKNRVLQPKNYGIENLTLKQNPDKQKDLVVSAVRVQAVKGGTWSLVQGFDGSEGENDRKMIVTLGGLKLPSLDAGDDKTIASVNLTQGESEFYKKDKDGKLRYWVLGDYDGDGKHDDPKGRMDLDVEVQIPKEYVPKPTKSVKGGTIAVAQFKVMYTLTTVGADGKPVGAYDRLFVEEHYEGPYLETGETP